MSPRVSCCVDNFPQHCRVVCVLNFVLFYFCLNFLLMVNGDSLIFLLSRDLRQLQVTVLHKCITQMHDR